MLDDEEGETRLLLKFREQTKRWNISTLFPDALIDELRRINLTLKDAAELPTPPGGWPTYRPEEVDEVLRNFTTALALAPNSAELHWRAALWTAFARGAAPLYTLWDPVESYALVPSALDRADCLFRRALALRPADIGANCMYGKFLEVGPAPAPPRARRVPPASQRTGWTHGRPGPLRPARGPLRIDVIRPSRSPPR